MLANQNLKIKQLVAAQIVKVFYPFVIAKTETGAYLKLNLSTAEQADPLFWDGLHSILKARLWVPISTRYHQLRAEDWLVKPAI